MATFAVGLSILVFITRSREPGRAAANAKTDAAAQHFSSCGKKDTLGHRLSSLDTDPQKADSSAKATGETFESTFGSPTTKGDTLGMAMSSEMKRSGSNASFTDTLDNDRFFSDN